MGLRPPEHKMVIYTIRRIENLMSDQRVAVNKTYIRRMIGFRTRHNMDLNDIIEYMIEDGSLKKFAVSGTFAYHVNDEQKEIFIKEYNERYREYHKNWQAKHNYQRVRRNNTGWKKLTMEELYKKKAEIVLKLELVNELIDEQKSKSNA